MPWVRALLDDVRRGVAELDRLLTFNEVFLSRTKDVGVIDAATVRFADAARRRSTPAAPVLQQAADRRRQDDDATAVDPIPVDVVDTTGAGDAFNGAFAVALAEGVPPETAARFGCAAGAAAVTTFDVIPSLPSRSDINVTLDG